jgi:hypothetical protein
MKVNQQQQLPPNRQTLPINNLPNKMSINAMNRNGKLLFWLTIGFALFALFGCAPQEKEQFNVYISVHNNKPEISSLSHSFLYTFSKRVNPSFSVAVEQARGNKVVSLFSQFPTRRAIGEVSNLLDGNPTTTTLDPVPSQDKTLASAMQRVLDHARKGKSKNVLVKAFILTEGTANPLVLRQLNQVSRKLAKDDLKVHLYLIGISSQNRLPMSRAFSPLKDSVFLAGNNNYEWNRYLRQGI